MRISSTGIYVHFDGEEPESALDVRSLGGGCVSISLRPGFSLIFRDRALALEFLAQAKLELEKVEKPALRGDDDSGPDDRVDQDGMDPNGDGWSIGRGTY